MMSRENWEGFLQPILQRHIDAGKSEDQAVADIVLPKQAQARELYRKLRSNQLSPQFEHDCKECVFLGRYDDNGDHYDLYYCDKSNPIPTVIARASSQPSDYISGLGFRIGSLIEAALRSVQRGLIAPDSESWKSLIKQWRIDDPSGADE